MSDKKRTILFSDKSTGDSGDFPIAVIWKQEVRNEEPLFATVVDPIFNQNVTNNLYGRIMTLVEATCDAQKLKAVKDLVGKELTSWASDVYRSARELADGGDSSENIYTR